MKQRLFLLFLFNLMCALISPAILARTDEVQLTGISNRGVTNTVIVEPVVEEAAEVATEAFYEEPVYEPVYEEPTPVYEEPTPVYEKPAPVVFAPQAGARVSDSITIAGRVLDIVDVDSTLVDSGDHVNHYDQKFYYGHNSSAVFGGIVNLDAGDTFSITRGGVTTNYRVATTVIYEKNTSNGLLQLNGEGDYMWYVAKARIGKTKYDVSLMTCYGRSLGGGDATHRFVIFANAI